MITKTKSRSYAEGLKELRTNLREILPADALSVFDNDATQLEKKHQSILKLQSGDHAPDFTLTNAVGENIQLSELLHSNEQIVLVFYRGTWCPYCNLQLNQYQKALEEIEGTSAKIVAISPQTPDESLSLKEKNALQFEVLSDPRNNVARQFTTVFKNGDSPVDTMTVLGFDFDAHYSDDSREIPVPAVFIIQKDRKITFAKTEGGDYRNRVEAEELITNLKQ